MKLKAYTFKVSWTTLNNLSDPYVSKLVVVSDDSDLALDHAVKLANDLYTHGEVTVEHDDSLYVNAVITTKVEKESIHED